MNWAALVLLAVVCLANSGSGSPAVDEAYPAPILSLGLQQSQGVLPDARSQERRRLSGVEADQMPLSWLMGSFFAYLYVGTPPQRVTVITDTGSHHTAFPCVGCKCGKHMDTPFDPSKSSTSEIMKCKGLGGLTSGAKCYFHQGYSEGSSWHAYEVTDRVWAGDDHISMLSASLRGTAVDKPTHREQVAASWSVPFKFGCQDKETGLFRTQEVDGIMGLSQSEQTLPYVLYRKGITKTRAFALCMRNGGGVLTLGGVDPTLHQSPLKWVTLLPPKAGRGGAKGTHWFTVRLLDIRIKAAPNQSAGAPHPQAYSIGHPAHGYAMGKGTILDSGTTDTYLPKEVTQGWNRLFSKASGGLKYSNRMMIMSDEEFARLPTIVYRFEALGGHGTVDVESPPTAYTETVTLPNGGVRRTFRIYTTESSGAVLGSNFMTGYNTVFDVNENKVGFAPSPCQYGDHAGAESAGSGGIVRSDGTAIDQHQLASWEKDHYAAPATSASTGGKVSTKLAVKAANKTASVGADSTNVLLAGVPALAVVDPNQGLGDEDHERQNAPQLLAYEYLEVGSFSAAAKRQLAACGRGNAELTSACTASCEASVGKAYEAEGTQTWVYTSCDAGRTKVVETEACSLLCGTDGRTAIGTEPGCLGEAWSDCGADCTQDRTIVGAAAVVATGSSSSTAVSSAMSAVKNAWYGAVGLVSGRSGGNASCPSAPEKRVCHAYRCPTFEGDWAVSADLFIAPAAQMTAKKWAHAPARREELRMAVALALRVPDSFVSLLGFRDEVGHGKLGSFAVTAKIRLPLRHYALQTEKTAIKVSEALRSGLASDLLAAATVVAAQTMRAGSGCWLLRKHLGVHAVQAVKLGADKARVKQGTARHAMSTGRTGSMSTTFLHPERWGRETYQRVFVVVLLQGVAVGLFFLWRRVVAIRAEPASQGFNAFKGTTQDLQSPSTDSKVAARRNGQRRTKSRVTAI